MRFRSIPGLHFAHLVEWRIAFIKLHFCGIDVVFHDANRFVVFEVKSCWSGPDDLQRGLYQCVKYRAVLMAQERPVPMSVHAILLTETRLPPELETRARELDVALKVHRVNPAR